MKKMIATFTAGAVLGGGSMLMFLPAPSKGKCEGECGKGTCPTGTVTSDGSNCSCKGINKDDCGCKGITKCYDNQGALIASVPCSGQCEWHK